MTSQKAGDLEAGTSRPTPRSRRGTGRGPHRGLSWQVEIHSDARCVPCVRLLVWHGVPEMRKPDLVGDEVIDSFAMALVIVALLIAALVMIFVR